jgi:NAD-dependent DNA ligase
MNLEETPKKINTADLANLMNKLAIVMNKTGEPMKARAYQKAEETLLGLNEEITDLSQLQGKPGIGPTIMEKMKEYLRTGTLELLEREKANPVNILTEVYGIGPKKAKELVEKGITTIETMRERQNEVLNDVQKIGLKYFEDILERIPRSEIDEYNDLFTAKFKEVAEEGSQYEIVGSYRRGAKTSGDIDVIITSKTENVFKKFIDALIQEKIIIEVLSRGKSKCLVITKIENSKHARRVDFLYTSPEEYPFSVLYFTGSKAFNTVMRGHALRLGYTLNEHRIARTSASGSPISMNFQNEKDIFDFLKLKYKEPVERIDGRAVVSLSPISEIPQIENQKTKKKREPKVPKEPKEKKIKIPKESKEKTRKKREPKVAKEPTPMKETFETMLPEMKEPIAIIRQNEPTEVKLAEEPIVKKEPKEPKTRKKREPKAPKEPKPPKEKKIKVPKEPKPPKEKKIKEPKEPKTRKIREPKPPKEPKEKKNKTQKESKQKEINKEIIIENMTIKPDLTVGSEKTPFEEFKIKGIVYLESSTEKQLAEMVKIASDYYYNTKTLVLTDNEYDIVKEYLERKFPKNTVLDAIGAPIIKNKVKLPYEMASMDKIKPDTNAVVGWMKKYKGPYVISCKLDGVSGLYTTEGDTPKLYTRGDGTVGQDISHLLKVLDLPTEPGIVVRGEFIIPKKVFDEKYKNDFANPRNLVSGIVNAKKMDSKAKDLHFVTYEVIRPVVKPSVQMSLLGEFKHEVVRNKTFNEISNDILSDLLVEWRTTYEYEIDGIIVCDDNIYPRESGNPDYAFAFKMVLSEQMAEAKVVDVLWSASKDGYLKPRVRIEPIKLGGVTIEYATGFNARFIEDNKIGIGALIQIIRSGDVIPHIKSVTMPAEHPKMPLVPYQWTSTRVDIVLENAGDDMEVREKNITAFFVGLEVDGLSSGNVKRIMTAGFDTIPKILKMPKTDFKAVEGFKEKMIEKVYTGIHDKVGKASLLDIMVASNLLGRGLGQRKIKPILEKYPDILRSKESDEDKIKMLREIEGIGPENAKSFVSNIPAFMAFLKECDLEEKLNSTNKVPDEIASTVDRSNPLFGKKIVMTKVRDKEIIAHLTKVGATLEDNIKKDTFVLIVKTHDDSSNKTEYATEHNIPIMTPQEFREKYMA